MSRQVAWQLRKLAEGKCPVCGKRRLALMCRKCRPCLNRDASRKFAKKESAA